MDKKRRDWVEFRVTGRENSSTLIKVDHNNSIMRPIQESREAGLVLENGHSFSREIKLSRIGLCDIWFDFSLCSAYLCLSVVCEAKLPSYHAPTHITVAPAVQ